MAEFARLIRLVGNLSLNQNVVLKVRLIAVLFAPA